MDEITAHRFKMYINARIANIIVMAQQADDSDKILINKSDLFALGEDLEEIVDSAVPKFNKDDYVEGIETVGVKGFDERTAFVRGWVNSVYGDYIDIQADDEYNGYRGTHIDFSTAKKIEPAKPRIVLL